MRPQTPTLETSQRLTDEVKLLRLEFGIWFCSVLGEAASSGHQAGGGATGQRRGAGQGEGETAEGGERAGGDGKETPAGKDACLPIGNIYA